MGLIFEFVILKSWTIWFVLLYMVYFLLLIIIAGSGDEIDLNNLNSIKNKPE